MKQKIISFYVFVFLFSPTSIQNFTLLLAPSGHATDTGRELIFSDPTNNQTITTYERAITYAWAQAVEIELLRRHPQLHVKLSRSPGETLIPLQIVSFANRLPADLVFSFHIFKQETEKPHLYMYYYSNNPFLEEHCKKDDFLNFIPLDKAHLLNKKSTVFWANRINSTLKNIKNSCFFDCAKVQQLPFKPFYGMLYPSIAFELGICRENQWKNTVSALADALEFLFL